MTWILVAHRARASLYEHRPDAGVRRLRELPGLEPHWPDEASGLAEVAAEKLAMVRFTLGLADVLEAGVREAQVDALILSLDTARRIHASLNVARPDWDEASLAAHLAPLLPALPSEARSNLL